MNENIISSTPCPQVKFDLKPPQDGDPCLYVAQPFPLEFCKPLEVSTEILIDEWLDANAPPEIQKLLATRGILREYCDDLALKRQIPAFIHAALLEKLPDALEHIAAAGKEFTDCDGNSYDREWSVKHGHKIH